ncbi:MAG: hypothetical protein WC817_00700 [Patescibacteria group bacterium]|jgi:hypothetical protein
MEWTTLEARVCGATGKPYVQLETVQGAELLLGGGEGGVDRETPSTRFCLNIAAKAFVPGEDGFAQDIDVQLWITPTQIAQLVKQYFSMMLWHTKPVYRQLLERLLRKRWSVMTSCGYKLRLDGSDRLEPYHKTGI